MADLTPKDGKTFLTGTWARTLHGIKDGYQIRFEDGQERADGTFVIEGHYVAEKAPIPNGSTFTVHLSIVTSTVPVSVMVVMFQAQSNAYAGGYLLRTLTDKHDRLEGSQLGIRGVGDRGRHSIAGNVQAPPTAAGWLWPASRARRAS